MKLFAVLGDPVLHSRSPQIWNHAFRQSGIAAQYFRINPLTASNAALALREMNLAGCNVTTPFKHDMVAYLGQADRSVNTLEAVNTIKNDQGTLSGWNTDAYGVVTTLQEAGFDLHDQKVVVLGAGGAARAAAYGLLRANTRDVVLVNRTVEKAVAVAARLGCRAVSFNEASAEIRTADILISCIPADGHLVSKEWFHPGLAVFDARYSSHSTLIDEARSAGCRIISGLNWLVHQAGPAFEVFFETNPAAVMQEAVQTSPPRPTRSVALIGFMGAGKTAVGQSLAHLMETRFLDTDRLIENRAGTSIPDIFSTSGEAGFRRLEQEVFETLNWDDGMILSCGGGAVTNPRIGALLRKHATVIWLWSSLATTCSRIRKGTRPLLEGNNMEHKAKELFMKRIPIYAECADLMVVNETVHVRRVAEKIYGEICQTSHS